MKIIIISVICVFVFLIIRVFILKRNTLTIQPLEPIRSKGPTIKSKYGWKLEDLENSTAIKPWEEILDLEILDVNYTIYDIDDTICVEWKSSLESWQNLAGRAGHVIISKKDRKQIDYIPTKIS